MACSVELSLLKEEEKVLLKILSKLNDHLNRLKVEELALQSYIRKQKNEQQTQLLQQQLSTTTSTTFFAAPLPVSEKPVDFTNAVNQEPLMDLNANGITAVKSGPRACESEEEEDDS
ncbi:hypothetical protein HELRODRAFT_174802 [Helobdella robusta]|uniref:Uncharacterized protein n=1 Tax=Helobdella robusta TaxID=6412 RepID=T1F8H8_HELRO|nr:hypothetical protein HELRODRAFT_174802 [Helobdella robusta]ESO01255.1 hypothetical protein HELRODRAFT_174802 [Helobdella robusta]